MKLVRVDMLEEVGEARANFKGGGIVLGSGENKFSKNSLHDNYNYEERFQVFWQYIIKKEILLILDLRYPCKNLRLMCSNRSMLTWSRLKTKNPRSPLYF